MATSDVSKVVVAEQQEEPVGGKENHLLKNNVIHLGVQNEGMCNKLLVTEQV